MILPVGDAELLDLLLDHFELLKLLSCECKPGPLAGVQLFLQVPGKENVCKT